MIQDFDGEDSYDKRKRWRCSMLEPMDFGEEHKHGWPYPRHIPGGKDEG